MSNRVHTPGLTCKATTLLFWHVFAAAAATAAAACRRQHRRLLPRALLTLSRCRLLPDCPLLLTHHLSVCLPCISNTQAEGLETENEQLRALVRQALAAAGGARLQVPQAALQAALRLGVPALC